MFAPVIHHLTRHIRSERGASLVEYTLLVGLIALVCVAALTALGGSTTEPYTDLSSGLQ